jgi:hypothetical protein
MRRVQRVLNIWPASTFAYVDADEAAQQFERHWEIVEDAEAPSARLLSFVAALLERYPDIPEDPTEDELDASVWTSRPLASGVKGRLLSVGVWDDEAVIAHIIEHARRQHLDVYDATRNQLLVRI